MRKHSLVNLFTLLAAATLLASVAEAGERVIQVDPGSYAAIAYSPATGKFGYAYNYRSRGKAEAEALRNCYAPDAQIACWVNKGFCALALGDDRSVWGVGYYYGNGSTNKDAGNRALAECRARTTGAYVAVALSSDGQYIWKSR